jgi:acyl-CoA thioester hydrolase
MIKPYLQEIRLIDCDVFGHVNNAVYLTYFEEARIYYFKELLGLEWNWKENGFIIKKNEIEYLYPIFHANKIEIEVRLLSIGNTSFELFYSIKDKRNGNILTMGKSVIIYYNHTIKETKILDSIIIQALLKLKQ